MEMKTTALVVADISGYTRFIVFRKLSQLHAEQIITDLIEAVAAKARHPLQLNKLEGDAAFFVSPIEAADDGVMDDIVAQVRSFFDAFGKTQAEHFKGCIGGCRCSACRTLENLRLKAFVHVGDVVHKTIGNFQEVGGEPVILIHRLLKNTVPGHEYLLLTEQAANYIQSPPFAQAVAYTERVEDFGAIKVVVYQPDGAPALVRSENEPLFTFDGLKDAVLTTWTAMANRVASGERPFRNIPETNRIALAS